MLSQLTAKSSDSVPKSLSSRTWPSADGKEDCPVNVTVTNLQSRITDFTASISYKSNKKNHGRMFASSNRKYVMLNNKNIVLKFDPSPYNSIDQRTFI